VNAVYVVIAQPKKKYKNANGENVYPMIANNKPNARIVMIAIHTWLRT
jgi:hypothetical protein